MSLSPDSQPPQRESVPSDSGERSPAGGGRNNCLLYAVIGGALLTLCLAIAVVGAATWLFLRTSEVEPSRTPVVEVTEGAVPLATATAEAGGGSDGLATPQPGEPTPRPTLTPVASERRSIYRVAIGECFQDPDFAATEESGTVETVEVVPCEAPHDNELYAAALATAEGDPPPFPGDEALSAQANRLCLDAFEPYVGIPYDDSFLAYLTIVPSEQSWATGDRALLCVLYDGTTLGELRGSMFGAEQ